MNIIFLFVCASFSSFAQETKEIQDSLQIQEALNILKEYDDNEDLRKAIIILKENIEQDQTGKALELLQKATEQSLENIGGKATVDSLLNCLSEDEYFQWFHNLARDSVQFSLYDVQGKETKVL